MTSDNLKLIDFCFPRLFQPLCKNNSTKRQNPFLWEWRQLPGSFGRIFQEFPFLQKAPEWPHNMRMIPPLSCKKDLNILEFLEFLYKHSVCIEPQDIEMFRVFCVNRTSRYCYFLDLLELSSLSQNDLKHRIKPSERQSWGICPAQSTRIAAPQWLNRAVVIICGCCSRILVIRGRFRQTSSRKSFSCPSLKLSAEGAVKIAKAKWSAGHK